MLLISASVKPSPIHGLGCFTNEKIEKGKVIWVLDDRIDRQIPAAELEALPKPVQEFLLMYAYSKTRQGQKVYILCGDHARHMNHSEAPNSASTGPDLEMDVAIRDIEAGEELTCNYYEFDLDGTEKLAPA
jgi:uncharacterized protein